jgi:hypothetical protein
MTALGRHKRERRMRKVRKSEKSANVSTKRRASGRVTTNVVENINLSLPSDKAPIRVLHRFLPLFHYTSECN